MGEPKNPHFHDFGIWGRVYKPLRPIIFISGVSRKPKQNKGNPWSILSYIIFLNFKMCGIPNLNISGKDGHRQISKILLIRSRRSWI